MKKEQSTLNQTVCLTGCAEALIKNIYIMTITMSILSSLLKEEYGLVMGEDISPFLSLRSLFNMTTSDLLALKEKMDHACGFYHNVSYSDLVSVDTVGEFCQLLDDNVGYCLYRSYDDV